jgi:hypothetical protein
VIVAVGVARLVRARARRAAVDRAVAHVVAVERRVGAAADGGVAHLDAVARLHVAARAVIGQVPARVGRLVADVVGAVDRVGVARGRHAALAVEVDADLGAVAEEPVVAVGGGAAGRRAAPGGVADLAGRAEGVVGHVRAGAHPAGVDGAVDGVVALGVARAAGDASVGRHAPVALAHAEPADAVLAGGAHAAAALRREVDVHGDVRARDERRADDAAHDEGRSEARLDGDLDLLALEARSGPEPVAVRKVGGERELAGHEHPARRLAEHVDRDAIDLIGRREVGRDLEQHRRRSAAARREDPRERHHPGPGVAKYPREARDSARSPIDLGAAHSVPPPSEPLPGPCVPK